MLFDGGAKKVGFASLETMAGGPTGVDITYLLPEAQSVISFYVPFSKEMILKYLGKEDPSIRGIHEEENLEIHQIIWRASQRVKHWLIEHGYKAMSVIPNNHYRTDIPGWQVSLPPELSLRYLAVRSGVASFGWSGNVGTKEHGTAIILGGSLLMQNLNQQTLYLNQNHSVTSAKSVQKSALIKCSHLQKRLI